MLGFDARTRWAAGSVGFAAAFSLGGYEFIRSASNTLFKGAYGADRLPVVMAMTPVGVLLVLWVYGRTLSWLGPRRTLLWSSLMSALIIAGCVLGVQAGYSPATAVLYICREAYVVLLIEQYWSFLNSTLDKSDAKKLNGPICGIASIGAILGGLAVHQLAERLGTVVMPVFAAASLLPAMVISDWGYARAGEPRHSAHLPSDVKGDLGLDQFRRNRVLVCLLLVVIATQVMSTVLDLRFQGILQEAIPDADKQTAFSGLYYSWLNVVAGVLQFAAAPVLLRFLPVRLIHLAIPCVHVMMCAVLLASPSLATAGAALMAFKALDYSVFRAAKELLYVPLSFDARYRAKEVIDVFGYRFSKGATALPFAIMKQMGLGVAGHIYGMLAVAAAAVWVVVAIPLTRGDAGNRTEKDAS